MRKIFILSVFIFSSLCSIGQSDKPKFGTDKQHIIIWQNFLMSSGYNLGISIPNGVFGKNTRRATLEFQRKSGLQLTGIADSITWTMAFPAPPKSKPIILTIIPPDTITIIKVQSPKTITKQLYSIPIALTIKQISDTIPDSLSVSFQLQAMAPLFNPVLYKPDFVFTKRRWQAKDPGDTIIANIQIEGNSVDSLPKDEYFIISICKADNEQMVKIIKTKTDTVVAKPNMISITNKNHKIFRPNYSANKQQINDTILLHLKLLKPTTDPYTKIVFHLLDTLANKFNITDSCIVLSKEEWNDIESRGKELDITLHIHTFNINDSLENMQKSFITIEGVHSQQTSFEVDLLSTRNKSFWLELGSNFDITDGFQANNLFAGIFLDKKDISEKRLRLFGGVYESKTISNQETASFKNFHYIDDSIGQPLVRNTVKLDQDSGTVIKNTSITSVGLFLSPQIRLTSKSANDDGLHIFTSLWIEMLWQQLNTNYDYTHTNRIDSTYIPKDSAFKNYNYKVNSQKLDIRSHYFGIGFPLYYKEGLFHLSINPVIGICNQAVSNSGNSTSFFSSLTNEKPGWRAFYLFQFRLNEEKYGIAFTGEVRGIINSSSENYYKPYISLALSKKFDLSKLASYVSTLVKY